VPTLLNGILANTWPQLFPTPPIHSQGVNEVSLGQQLTARHQSTSHASYKTIGRLSTSTGTAAAPRLMGSYSIAHETMSPSAIDDTRVPACVRVTGGLDKISMVHTTTYVHVLDGTSTQDIEIVPCFRHGFAWRLAHNPCYSRQEYALRTLSISASDAPAPRLRSSPVVGLKGSHSFDQISCSRRSRSSSLVTRRL